MLIVIKRGWRIHGYFYNKIPGGITYEEVAKELDYACKMELPSIYFIYPPPSTGYAFVLDYVGKDSDGKKLFKLRKQFN